MAQQSARPENDGRKFPPLEPIEYDTHRAFKPKNKEGFVGSHHEGLIEDISDIKCSECSNPLIDGSPMTGICGHLFCYTCAYLLHQSSGEVVNEELERRPANIKELEIYVDDGPARFFYKCKACDKELTSGIKTGYYMKLFYVNIVLKDIYTTLKKYDGFFCIDCKKRDELNKRDGLMHPPYNSLHCEKCSKDRGKFRYTCVWHGHLHIKNRCQLSIQYPESRDRGLEDIPMPDQPYKAESNHRLASLDRSHRKLYAALYHCACCSTSLKEDTALRCSDEISHLECGHFIGPRCVKIARDKMMCESGAGVYCIFCDKDIKPGPKIKPFIPRSIQLAGIVLKPSYKFYRCGNHCDECEFRACDSMTYGPFSLEICTWCHIEHQVGYNCTYNYPKS